MKAAWLVLMVISFAASMATPAAAGTVKYPYSCEENLVSFTPGGIPWVEEGALHLRGWTYVYDVVGDPGCAGDLTVLVNFNLDLTTWSGVLWGTATNEHDAIDGGFNITWKAHWTAINPLSPDATDIWEGQYVGRGFGELDGWQARGTIEEQTHQLVNEEGYAFLPGA